MALPTFPQAVADYIAGLTDEDFINGGHRTNFIPTAQGGMTLADYVRLAAIEMVGLAEQVEEDAASAAAGSGTEVTVEQIWAGAAAQYLSIRRALAAQARQTIPFATPVAWDMASGINFTLTLTADTVLSNPTNPVAGKSGFIDVYQDATGGREITSFGSNYKWIGGNPSLAVGPSRLSKIAYYVATPTEIHMSFAGSDAEPV